MTVNMEVTKSGVRSAAPSHGRCFQNTPQTREVCEEEIFSLLDFVKYYD